MEKKLRKMDGKSVCTCILKKKSGNEKVQERRGEFVRFFLAFMGLVVYYVHDNICRGVQTFIVINYYGRIQNPSETIRNC